MNKAAMKSPAWSAFVFVLLALMALLFTAPLALHLNTHIPGYRPDINYFFWANWWFGKAVEKGTNPWWTDMLWSPNGTPLVFSTNRFVSAAAGWLIAPLTGLVTSYNLILLLAFPITGFGIYLLARELTGNRIASFAAAVVFTFNPWKFHKLQSQHNFMSSWFFGFTLLLLLRIVRRDDRPVVRGLALGTLLAVTLYESLVYFDFLILALFVFTVWLAVFDRKSFWRASTSRGLLYAALSFAILSLPMVLMIVDALPEYGGIPQAEGAQEYSNDLLHIIWPSPMPWMGFGEHPSRLFTPANQTYGSSGENFGPIGYIVLPLAIWGWWVGRKRHRQVADACAVGALLFALLSLGPALQVGGNQTGVPMLYSLLQAIPAIGLVRTPSRFIILTFLFLAPLVAFAIEHSSRRRLLNRSWIIPLVLTALVVIDYMPHGSAIQDRQAAPAPLKALSAVPGDFAVLPIGYSHIDNMRLAPVHGKPSTAGYIARITLFTTAIQHLPANLLLSLSDYTALADKPERAAAMAATARRIFNAWGIGAVMHVGPRERLLAATEIFNGSILAEEEEHAVILLPSLTPVQPGLDLTAETLPPMTGLNIGGSAGADQLWTGISGFRLAIPDSLMPEGRIELTLSSAFRLLDGKHHKVYVFFNRALLATIDAPTTTESYAVSIPPDVERRPVNLITIRNELEEGAEGGAGLPFRLSALSGNEVAGSYSALVIGETTIMPLRQLGAAVFVAATDDEGQQPGFAPIQVSGEQFGQRLAGTLRSASHQPWIILFTSGNLDSEAVQNVVDAAREIGLELNADEITGRSFALVINTRTSAAGIFSSDNGYVHILSGELPPDERPVLNIQAIRLR